MLLTADADAGDITIKVNDCEATSVPLFVSVGVTEKKERRIAGTEVTCQLCWGIDILYIGLWLESLRCSTLNLLTTLHHYIVDSRYVCPIHT